MPAFYFYPMPGLKDLFYQCHDLRTFLPDA